MRAFWALGYLCGWFAMLYGFLLIVQAIGRLSP